MYTLRYAKKEDALFLAQSILIAGRAHVQKGIWEIVLDCDEEACLAFLGAVTVTDVPHLFHYTCSIVAENDQGELVGSLAGHDPQVKGYQALQQAIPEVVAKVQFPTAMQGTSTSQSERILACMPQVIEGAWVIDSVATLPSARGRGVAEELLARVLEEGKQQRYRLAQVNVYIGNEPALNLYRKYGFEVVEEKRDPYFEQHIGSPGMVSLKMTLS
jgi:ribosomal protein S18 acetylase RimI-like enzyme